MGLDVGGRSVRALLVEPASGETAVARRPWRPLPSPGAGGLGSDIDLADLWTRLGAASREALARAGASPDDVLGVAATAGRHSVVVVDGRGRALYAGSGRDERAEAEGHELAAHHGAELHTRTGHWPTGRLAASRLRWLAAREPDALRNGARFLSLSDWLALRLCGELASEPTQAGGTLLFDLNTRDWAWDWIERLGLPAGLFPPVRAPGAPLGSLAPRAASALGLRAGMPVAAGAADAQSALIGLGALEPGDCALVAGATAPLQLVLAAPRTDRDARIQTGHHALPGRWVLESHAGPIGEALDWLGQLLFPEADEPTARLLVEAAASEPGAGGLLSTFGAQVMNAREPSLPIGALTLSHRVGGEDSRSRAHVTQAVIEGIAYALRANLEQICEVAQGVPRSLRVAGGLSQSARFTALLSDVADIEVEVGATPEASALGAAICGGVGAGAFPDLATGAARLGRAGRVHRPDPDRATRHRGGYLKWWDLREAREEADDLARNAVLQGLFARSRAATTRPVEAPRPRILVTADLDEAGVDALRKLGDVDYQSFRTTLQQLTAGSLVGALRGFHVFVTEADVVDAAALSELPNLRVVATCLEGGANVDLEACSELGIPVLHAPGRSAGAVADLTLAFLLMLARKLPRASGFLRRPASEAGDIGRLDQAFASLQGHELWRKTVGLVGLGAVGEGVARRLRPFGARVLVHDPTLDRERASRLGAEPVSLGELLERSDFVSLHGAAIEEWRGLIDARALRRMRRGTFLVNTARADLVDEAALTEALNVGHLAGAALDVFSVDPPGSDHPLLALDSVIATPRVAENTAEVAAHQGASVAADLARLLRGERPAHALNPEVLEAFDWSKPRPPLGDAAVAELRTRPRPALPVVQGFARRPGEPAA
jgi:autoinducer 2 (AI-2) kinase